MSVDRGDESGDAEQSCSRVFTRREIVKVLMHYDCVHGRRPGVSEQSEVILGLLSRPDCAVSADHCVTIKSSEPAYELLVNALADRGQPDVPHVTGGHQHCVYVPWDGRGGVLGRLRNWVGHARARIYSRARSRGR